MNWMKSFHWDKLWLGAASLFTNAWVFLMLAVFPLYAPNRYFDLGDHKFKFFLWCSVGCLLPALVLFGLRAVFAAFGAHLAADDQKRPRQHGYWFYGSDRKKVYSVLDLAVLCWLAVQLLSFWGSEYKQDAWIGTKGWFMGLRTQLLLATAYFCVSRARLLWKVLLAGYVIGSGSACLFGILHRFRIDPLGMYEGISEKYYLEFLSTLGQATWFSSFICTVMVIGVAFFILSESPWARVGAGLYCVLVFGAVVTQNSDSAFLAVGALVFGLLAVCCRSMEKMERFLELLILMLGSFKIIGLLQQIFGDRAIQLDGISTFLSQSLAGWIGLLAVVLVYTAFLGYRVKWEEKTELKARKWMIWSALLLPAAGIGVYVLILWLNTTGRLPVQIEHRYLLFDDAWGNYRGVIWKVSMQAFGQMDWLEKLTGAGPDCFWRICYEDAKLGGRVQFYFGENQLLTNAHNEFLNVLICSGILGLAAFLGVMAAAACRFLGGFCQDPLILAGGLAVLTYCAHNFFCYQQVCCTPFLFMLLALAENRLRRQNVGALRTE